MRGALLIALIAAAFAGCGSSPVVVDGTVLLRYGFLTGSPTGELRGLLKLDSGCTWLEHTDVPGVRELVLWPSDTNLDNSSGSLRVVAKGRTYADGDLVLLAGGQYKDEDAVRDLVGPFPASCETMYYWLATNISPG